MTSANQSGDYMCWREIGITGDRSCELLDTYVHCRNCPQYSHLGRTLFDREMSGDFRREVTDELAAATATVAEEVVSVLVLRTGSEWFALRSLVLEEIMAYQKPYALPFRSGALLTGLVNVNGELILCISLEAALGLRTEEKSEAGGRPRLCVVRSGSERFAFNVDDVLGVRRVPCAELQAVPVTVAKSPSALTTSCLELDGYSVGLIDDRRLFDSLDRSLRW